jgi:hypothetical protein
MKFLQYDFEFLLFLLMIHFFISINCFQIYRSIFKKNKQTSFKIGLKQ